MSRSTISTFKLFELFPDEPSARKYLEGRLWKDGITCPECKFKERITTRKDGFYRCNPCKLDFTVRTGTIFERSHVPLHKWLYAMYLLVAARKGISSLQLGKEIGITQKSAWFVLHRLREACGTELEKLQGTIEIDEAYFGGEENNRHMYDRINKPRQRSEKALDAIADVVLAYRPKPKTKAAKRRIRRKRQSDSPFCRHKTGKNQCCRRATYHVKAYDMPDMALVGYRCTQHTPNQYRHLMWKLV
jgi:transposase-like protein